MTETTSFWDVYEHVFFLERLNPQKLHSTLRTLLSTADDGRDFIAKTRRRIAEFQARLHYSKRLEMTTRICVAIRTFDKHPLGLPACTRRVRLPDTRVLYTVLRSPHIDKKSREQFHMISKKQLLVIDTKASELQKKFFWLKRQRILGAQYEIILNSNTRLDKGKLQALLNKETDTTPAADLGLKSIISS